MNQYRAALVGCGRMGAFIDNEVAGSGAVVLPYSHAAGYEACDRTDLIAGADMRQEVLDKFGERYSVPPTSRYTDFRDLIREERPDILSIATQPHQRAEVARFAIEHGVRALYVEKPLCASMAEAMELRDAAHRAGVVVNMGTNRRWDTGFAAMRAAIASGDYGRLVTLTTLHRSTLFNTHSHWVDTLRVLNGDAPVEWVQGYVFDADAVFDGDRVVTDPVVQGTISFANGVMAHLIATPGGFTHHAYCEGAELVAIGKRVDVIRADGETATLAYEPVSSTLRLVEDIVHALDTGEPPRGGIDEAYANTEILFGLLESHRRGGARVPFPLVDSTLAFVPADLGPRQPTFAPPPA